MKSLKGPPQVLDQWLEQLGCVEGAVKLATSFRTSCRVQEHVACVDSRQTLLLSRDVKQHTALEGPGIATHIDMYIHACI